MTQSQPPSKAMLWTGRVLTVLPALLLLFSGTMKLTQPAKVEEFLHGHFGYPAGLAVTLGIIEVGCTILYLIPQTAIIGAILLTGYLGGAIATHVHASEPPFMQILVPIVLWGGIWLRDARLRELMPLRKPE